MTPVSPQDVPLSVMGILRIYLNLSFWPYRANRFFDWAHFLYIPIVMKIGQIGKPVLFYRYPKEQSRPIKTRALF